MKYDKRINGIWKCCSKELSRYSLNSARLDAEKRVVVATDGHILSAVDVSDLMDLGEESFMIPLEALKFAQSLMKKDSPVVRIEKRGDAVAVTQGGRDVHFYYPNLNVTFPKWEAAIPESNNGYNICISLNAELLGKLSDALQDDSHQAGVNIWFKDRGSSVIVSSLYPNGKKYAVLMPMRGEAEKPKKFWTNKPAEVNKEVA